MVPVKVQDLLRVPFAALPRPSPRQGQVKSDYPEPGRSELGLTSGAYKARLLPRSTSPRRPEGSPPEVRRPGGVASRVPAPRRTTPAGVDVNHGNAERAAAGRRGAVTSLQLICLPVGIADLLPAGGPNLFTRKNAALWMPVHHLFPRVTRGTFSIPTPWRLLCRLNSQASAKLRCPCSFKLRQVSRPSL